MSGKGDPPARTVAVTSWRLLDPIRAKALECAVAVTCAEIRAGLINTWEMTLDRAAKFEEYLDPPKDPDGQG